MILLFTLCKHHHKQISAVILKPNSKITSRIRYIYEYFMSYDSSDLVYIYTRICNFFVHNLHFKCCDLLRGGSICSVCFGL